LHGDIRYQGTCAEAWIAAIILAMPEQPSYRYFPAIVALLTLLVFLPALGNDFVNWDDERNFLLNPNYRGLGWTEIEWMWTTHLLGRYVPITWMTLGLDYTIWGMNPLGYHLTSVLFHAVNAVLFYFLALALLRLAMPDRSKETQARIPIGALFAALVFALHPLRVESVAWVTERRDVVSGMFFLLSILAYLRGNPDLPGAPIRRKYYWACFGFFILALLSKEIAVTLPVVLLILDVFPLRRLGAGITVFLEKIPFLLLGVADGALALYIGKLEGITASIVHVNWFVRLAISLYGLAFYFKKTVLPFSLAPFYALIPYKVDPRQLPFQLSIIFVALVTAGTLMARRKYPAALAAWVAYAVMLSPVLGIFHNGQQITADRYSYLACLCWAILGGGILVGTQRRVVVVAAGVVICGLGYLTVKQILVWRNSETLWTQAVAVAPSFIAYNNLGLVYSARGDHGGAIEQYRHSIQMAGDYELSHNNLGAELLELGLSDEAIHEFQTALTLKPNLAQSHNGWGQALLAQGKVDEAIEHFRAAVQMDPAYDSPRTNLEHALEMKRH
jgi:Tfp pilus assembly protein PilF